MYENYRPDWLHGLELDFFFPKLRLGVEFQGDQHFVPTKAFGSQFQQRKRDKQKFILCKVNGVKLLRLTADDLRYGRLRGKLRKLKVTMLHGPKHHVKKVLGKLSEDYRKLLVEKFDSPSALSGEERKAARKRNIDAYRVSKGLRPLEFVKHTRADIKPVKPMTKADIEAGRTPAGGFTRATLESWGVPWPPPKHWRKTLVNFAPTPQPNPSAQRQEP